MEIEEAEAEQRGSTCRREESEVKKKKQNTHTQQIDAYEPNWSCVPSIGPNSYAPWPSNLR